MRRLEDRRNGLGAVLGWVDGRLWDEARIAIVRGGGLRCYRRVHHNRIPNRRAIFKHVAPEFQICWASTRIVTTSSGLPSSPIHESESQAPKTPYRGCGLGIVARFRGALHLAYRLRRCDRLEVLPQAASRSKANGDWRLIGFTLHGKARVTETADGRAEDVELRPDQGPAKRNRPPFASPRCGFPIDEGLQQEMGARELTSAAKRRSGATWRRRKSSLAGVMSTQKSSSEAGATCNHTFFTGKESRGIRAIMARRRFWNILGRAKEEQRQVRHGTAWRTDRSLVAATTAVEALHRSYKPSTG